MSTQSFFGTVFSSMRWGQGALEARPQIGPTGHTGSNMATSYPYPMGLIPTQQRLVGSLVMTPETVETHRDLVAEWRAQR